MIDLALTLTEPCMHCIEITINKFGIEIQNIEEYEQVRWGVPVTIHHSMFSCVQLTGEGNGGSTETHLINGIVVYGELEYAFIKACIKIQTAMFA